MALNRLNPDGSDFNVTKWNDDADKLESMHVNVFGPGVLDGLVPSSPSADTVHITDGHIISRSWVSIKNIPDFTVANGVTTYVWVTETGAIIPTGTAVNPGSNSICICAAINTGHTVTFDLTQRDVGFHYTSRGTLQVGQKALSIDTINNKVGIAVASPAAVLHVGAGTSLLPQIILNSGTLLAAPVPNAIEYDGVNVWLTLNDGTTKVPINRGAVNIDMHLGDIVATPPQYAARIITLIGALTANQILTLPISLGLDWIIRNNTTGAFTVTVKGPTGTGIAVTQGDVQPLYADGVNFKASAAPSPIS